MIFQDKNGNVINSSNPNTIDSIIRYIVILMVSTFIFGLLLYNLNCMKNMKKSIKLITLIVVTLTFSTCTNVVALEIGKTTNGVIDLNFNFSMVPIDVWNGTVSDQCFRGGNGSKEDPYKIENGQDLACFTSSINDGNTYSGKYVKLVKDIILNENVVDNEYNLSDKYNEFNYLIPGGSGTDNNIYFGGVFDGDNHTINGLYVNNSEQYQGLFASTRNAEIKNLGMKDYYVSGERCVSAIAATAANTNFKNIELEGYISGGHIGGLVGFAMTDPGELNAENVNVKVKFSSYATGVGRLFGMVSSVNNFDNIQASAVFEGGSIVGGILGQSTTGATVIKIVLQILKMIKLVW